MNVKRIFLDNYELSEKDDATLIIVPPKDENGNRAPNIYYKRKDPYWLVDHIDTNTIWVSDMKLNISVDQDKYNELIDWWFDNMTEDYQNHLLKIADSAIEIGFDLSMSVKKAREKLKLADKQKRKSNIGKFLIDWVSVGCSRYINKQRNNSIYS